MLLSDSLVAEGLDLDFLGRFCQSCRAFLIRLVSDVSLDGALLLGALEFATLLRLVPDVSLDDPFLLSALDLGNVPGDSDTLDSVVTWLAAESLSSAMASRSLGQGLAGFF